MSRVEKYSRRHKTKQQETDLQVNHEHINEELPPRIKKHISSKQKLHRFFYNLIFIFFIILVVALFIYGYNNTNAG